MVAEGEIRPSLLCVAGSNFCALPLEHVAEITRPLPIEAISGAPSFVAGFSVLRGSALPVVMVERLLGDTDGPATRLVTVRFGNRRIGLAFTSVIGVRSLGSAVFSGLPPLLDPGSTAIAEIGALDGDLIVMLNAARIVPQDVFAMLDALELAS